MVDPKSKVKFIRFSEEEFLLIEKYRGTLQPVPTFSEAVRQLILAGLQTKGLRPQD